ncbi:GNAT family N-acetyltransferase [Vibrio panuliri]|uniref:Ribosomal-protein-L7/L12-serine acetyltransferase n=1 Tax=Vibrio panuliri TaxID=1381081 RepID=A0A1Q9HQW9_9VIBR|nr:GNAT family protein [Vibrio panuliri]KAB1458162.1 GNAT family N-acetyltransferase [Vibrio panuliri]OLQ89454.1 ribosomal-protein-L7/L12-serine acetyltransferase [Vibrio panuliri]OLQ93277.1 ribosomal-protein-L7/L12-serine acetyltransferase [Vibrio panuliri]
MVLANLFSLTIDDELQLALVDESFAPIYCQLVSTQQAYLSQWLAWPPYCQSEQDFRLFIQRSLNDYAEGKSLTCAIIYQGNIVGNCSFNSIDHDLKRVAIGYWLSQDFTQRGIMTRVVNKLIEIAFTKYQMEKVELSAAVDNLPSRAVAERCGMTLEGVISNSEKIGERILDHAIYAIHKQTP